MQLSNHCINIIQSFLRKYYLVMKALKDIGLKTDVQEMHLNNFVLFDQNTE